MPGECAWVNKMTIPDRIIEEASAWFVRQSDDAMDWDAFTLWLEADPRHRMAFDQLCNIDADLDNLRETTATQVAANDDPAPRRWAYWTGGGVVAAALALVIALQPGAEVNPIQDYWSTPGQVRQLVLGDGTNVTLAPASRLVARGNIMSLEGSAYFDVVHRVGRTLTIKAAGLTVSDIGTRFEVASYGDSAGVKVAEGQVSVAAPGLAHPIQVTTGHALAAEGGSIRVSSFTPQTVAAWRQGKLIFDNVPLALAVRDVTRYSGTKINVDPAIGSETFSGVIAIHDGKTAARDIAEIVGSDVREVDGGIRIVPRHR